MNYRRNIRINPLGTILRHVTWIIFGLVVVWYLFFPTNFSQAVLYFAEVLWQPADAIAHDRPMTSRAELIDENERLKYLLESMEGDFLSSEARKVENAELKAAFNRFDVSTKHTVLAAVLARPPYTLYDNLVIDIGTANGVKAGALVFALGTTTEIGQVAVANTNQSIIKLHSSPGSEFDVLIGPNHVSTRVVGKGNGSFEMTLPRDSGVAVMDYVISPNISSNYIGTVDSLEPEETRTYVKGLISSPINPNQIRFVQVAK